jgi:mono/diheme cytochrome c family protein
VEKPGAKPKYSEKYRGTPGLWLGGIACYCAVLSYMTSCTKPLTENEQTGKALYDTHCSECHEENQLRLKKVPAKLHNIFSKPMLPDGVTPATDASVRQVIIYGKRTMPAFNGQLNEEQAKDLVAYLHRR